MRFSCSRTITPKENCLPTLKLTQTLTLTFSSEEIAQIPIQLLLESVNQCKGMSGYEGINWESVR